MKRLIRLLALVMITMLLATTSVLAANHQQATPARSFALFSTDAGCTTGIEINGGTFTINGDVHSNSNIELNVSSGGADVHGLVSAVGTVDASLFVNFDAGSPIEGADSLTSPVSWDIADFRPDGQYALIADALGEYHEISTENDFDAFLDGNGYLLPGIYYVDGEMAIGPSTFYLGERVTIVVEDQLEIRELQGSSGPYTAPGLPVLPLLFSNYAAPNPCSTTSSGAAIILGPSAELVTGIIYAPAGAITASYANIGPLNVSLFATAIDLTGSNIELHDALGYPTNVSASAISATEIDLEWEDNSVNETSFSIERSDTGFDNWVEIDTNAADDTTYSDTGLSCHTTYFYRVRAHRTDDNQYSTYSHIASATTDGYACGGSIAFDPSEVTIPEPTSISSSGAGSITLGWTDKSTDEHQFHIYRMQSPADPTNELNWPSQLSPNAIVATTDIIGMGAVQSWEDTSVVCGTTYYYRVAAHRIGSVSSPQYSGYTAYEAQAPDCTPSVAPTITSAASTIFAEGAAGSFTVTATGDPAPTFSLTGTLPAGVSFNAATGVLSGSPALNTAGTYPVTITATNGVNPNAQQSFTLNVVKTAVFGEPGGNSACAKMSSIVNLKFRGMVTGRAYTYTLEVRDDTTVYMIRRFTMTFAGPTGTQTNFKWIMFPVNDVPALNAPQTYSSTWPALPATVYLKVTAVDRTTNLMTQTTMIYTCANGLVNVLPSTITPNVTTAPYAP